MVFRGLSFRGWQQLTEITTAYFRGLLPPSEITAGQFPWASLAGNNDRLFSVNYEPHENKCLTAAAPR